MSNLSNTWAPPSYADPPGGLRGRQSGLPPPPPSAGLAPPSFRPYREGVSYAVNAAPPHGAASAVPRPPFLPPTSDVSMPAPPVPSLQSSPPPLTPPSSRVPYPYISQPVACEEGTEATMATTGQHFTQMQRKEGTDREYEQLHRKNPQSSVRDRKRQDQGSYAPENAVRHGETVGHPATASSSPFLTAPNRNVEFVIGSPRYVYRLGVLFLVTLFGILSLMSTFAFTTLLCGVVLLYIADYLGYHRTTVFILLGTAAVFAVSLLLSNLHAAVTSFGPMLMIADIAGILITVVAAAMQHFRWVQETIPNVLCTLERLVFAVGPLLCLPPLLTTTTALVGSRYAPFFFFLVLCALHNFFYCPLKSSFLVSASPDPTGGLGDAVPSSSPKQHQPLPYALSEGPGAPDPHSRGRAGDKGDSPQERTHAAEGEDDVSSLEASASTYGTPLQLNEQPEALLFSCVVLLLPIAVYNGFQSNWPEHVVANVLNSLGLACGGVAYFCIMPVNSLWFLASPQATTYSLSQQLEFDPHTLFDAVAKARIPLLASTSLVGVHWAAYRLLGSRYGYLFSGVAFPFNAILLLLAFYISVYVGIEIKKLLDDDSQGVDVTKGRYLAQRGLVILGSCVIAVIFCVLTSAPGVFYFPAVLSLLSLNLFLMDRTNGGPMFSFTIFTSLMLLWWMYRTYSFIAMDLRVFGEATAIPTPVVAVSVLWCYVLGCMSFTLSFSSNKVPLTIVLFLLALQITFVEHVLYSQKDEGAYPAFLVALTSAVGILVPCRMYANEALGVYSAALIASCYASKFLTFMVEVTSSYYAAELNVHDKFQPVRAWLLMAEMTGGWWVALLAGYLVALFEIEQRKQIKMTAAKSLLYSYAGLAVLLSLLTIRNVQRAAYEFVTQSYVTEHELVHIAPGTCCVTYALLTLPVWWRLKNRYVAVFPLRAISRGTALLGLVLLAVQPSRVMENEVSQFDYDFEYADKGRYATTLGLLLVLSARLRVFQRIPSVLRGLYWLVTAASLALGIVGLVQVAPTLSFYFLMLGLVFLALLMVDAAHYRDVNGVVLITVYVVSIFIIPLSFLQFNRFMAAQREKLLATPERLANLWDMYEQGSMRLLAVIVAVHLGLSILLNCRLSGRPLLPKCREISHDACRSLGAICNFSTELAVALLCAINFYGNDSEPALYVLSSLLLLLFVNDEVIFFELQKQSFRYFPPTACALVLLWFCTVWNAWRMAATSGLAAQLLHIGAALLRASVTLPAQASLLKLLWMGRKVGSSPSFVVVASVVLCVACLLFVSDKAIQWMSIVAIFGQCARLFDSKLQQTSSTRRRR